VANRQVDAGLHALFPKVTRAFREQLPNAASASKENVGHGLLAQKTKLGCLRSVLPICDRASVSAICGRKGDRAAIVASSETDHCARKNSRQSCRPASKRYWTRDGVVQFKRGRQSGNLCLAARAALRRNSVTGRRLFRSGEVAQRQLHDSMLRPLREIMMDTEFGGNAANSSKL